MTIPAQRVPVHDTLSPAPRRRRRLLFPALLVVLLGVLFAIPLDVVRAPVGTLAAAAGPPKAMPPNPYELAEQTLKDQAAALLRGNRAGWLAAVDPKQPALRKRYQDLYASLRALHVTQFEYHARMDAAEGDSITTKVDVAFCLSAATCPRYVSGGGSAPYFVQQLTLRAIGGRYLITKLSKAKEPTSLQPLPWEAGSLVFAQGKRVTVAAPRSLAKHLRKVLAAADRAAVINDRIARYMNNPQQRYRVFLATDRAWKTWYGGQQADYSVAFAIPLYEAGSDVVLRMSELGDDAEELKVVIQHELAHVATLSNLGEGTGNDTDLWLMEGVAEYAGWHPQHARSSWNFPAVRAALRGGKAPRTMVRTPIKDNASGRTVDAFYGLGHLAVDCLVTKYGEAKAMTFIRLKVRTGASLEEAAKGAFGTPFAAVDKACITWMRKTAG